MVTRPLLTRGSFTSRQQELAYLFAQQLVHSDGSPGHRCAPTRSRGGRTLIRPLFVEELDDVALEELIETAEHDTALVARRTSRTSSAKRFRPSQRVRAISWPLRSTRTIEPRRSVPSSDEAAGDLAEPARLEDLPDFGVAIDDRRVNGLVHARERLLYVFERPDR